MYVRDKRSPTPKSETVSRVMSANRARDTGPEIRLRKALHHAGLRGYRVHFKIKLPSKIQPSALIPHPSTVRPDISFVRRRLAIFVHGCCPKGT